MFGKKRKAEVEDILLNPVKDRRLLANVPDPERSGLDRRGEIDKEEDLNAARSKLKKTGTRYRSRFPVEVRCYKSSQNYTKYISDCENISATGILLDIHCVNPTATETVIKEADRILLKFKIPPGAMPEGFEMKVKLEAAPVRIAKVSEGDRSLTCAFNFTQSLVEFSRRKKDRYALTASSMLLFLIVAFIMLMRAGSIIYFKFNKGLYLYSIVAAVFLLSRYLFGALYKVVPQDPKFTPRVTIIIPCFNEEEWIQQTIVSCVNQDYPVDCLEVIVVDDCSTDASVAKIVEIIDMLHKENPRLRTNERVSYVVQPRNRGKRDALARGAELASHELLVFVDSDSFLDPFAIRNLVQPFKDPKMGGVSGRCDVANTFTNGLSKMQAVRYYIAFRIMKAAEAYFDAVTCLSGPLACYKREIVLRHSHEWLNQKFLGQRATFGDDRAMTNFVLRYNRTGYQDTAICSTIVPNRYKVFLKQQMRWKRSWLRESIMAGKYIWKKEPFAALFFYMGLAVPILGPIVVIYNLFYVPITQKIFPTTFLLGLFLMASLMSTVQLLFKKSSTWAYGFFFCLFYEAVLLWQMPIAIVTFWKSTWGTRMTPEDVAEKALKDQKKKEKKGRGKQDKQKLESAL